MIYYLGVIKLKVDKTVKGELQDIKNESAVNAEFIPLSENEFIVKCKIIENNAKIFEIETMASSREQAVRIVKNWEENANKIYPEVIGMINKETEEEDVKNQEKDLGQITIE